MHSPARREDLRHLERVVRHSQQQKNEVRVSLVIAVSEAGERLDLVLGELAQFLAQRTWRSEVIVIDDASPDGAALRAASFEQRFHDLQVLRHGTARGLGEALRTGVQVARGAFVFPFDLDDALPLSALPQMLAHLERGAAVVAAELRPASRWSTSVFERIGDTAFRTLARFLTPVDGKDVGGAFHGFRRDGVKEIAKRSRIKSRSWAVEWIALARKMHLRVEELKISGSENEPFITRRRDGRGAPRGNAIRDLWQIRRNFDEKAYARARKDHAGLFDTSFVKLDGKELESLRARVAAAREAAL